MNLNKLIQRSKLLWKASKIWWLINSLYSAFLLFHGLILLLLLLFIDLFTSLFIYLFIYYQYCILFIYFLF